MNKLQNMLMWPDNWNGHGAVRPDHKAIAQATTLLKSWEAIAHEPHITGSADGDVVFEWWHGKRKLTVYVSDGVASYVKVWGPNMVSEMEDGEIGHNVSEFVSLWNWLTEIV